MIDPANYIIRVRDVNANHVVDYGLTKGMLMALSQLGLLNKAPFGVEQPRGWMLGEIAPMIKVKTSLEIV